MTKCLKVWVGLIEGSLHIFQGKEIDVYSTRKGARKYYRDIRQAKLEWEE